MIPEPDMMDMDMDSPPWTKRDMHWLTVRLPALPLAIRLIKMSWTEMIIELVPMLS